MALEEVDMTKIGPLSVVGSFLLATVLNAVPVAASSLDPTPPPFVACKTTGAMTHCSGQIDVTQTAVSSGFACSSFEILENALVHLDFRLTYNSEGKATIWVIHVNQPLPGGHNIWFNATDPSKFVPQVGNWNVTLDFVTPGDFATVVETDTGLFSRVVLPGGGSIALDAGKTVFDPDFNILFEAGRHFLTPGSEPLQRVCDALM
jgi:hypothetical protein